MSLARLSRPPLFHGWYIVAFAFVAQTVAGPYVFSMFFRPMTEELGWSRGEFSLANTFSVVVSGGMGFFVGPMVDGRHGRWLVMAGAIVAGVSLASLALIDDLWQFWAIRGVVYVFGTAGISPLVLNATLSKWFVRQRGRAISIASMGLSAGAVVLAPAVAWVIEMYGWRTAWAVQGGILLVALVVPALLIIRRQPEDIGLLPDGDTEASARAHATTPAAGTVRRPRLASTEHQWTRAEAIRTKELWMLIAIFGIGMLPSGAMVLHLVPFLQDVGFSIGLAVFIYSFENMWAFASKPVWGYYLDKFDPRHLVALGWGMKVVPLFVLPLLGSEYGLWIVLAMVALYGAGVGSGQTGQEVIWAHYFGRRHIGAVRGVAMPFTIIFSAGGTWFAGAAWDVTGSYTFSFMLFAALSLISMVGIVMIRPPARETSTPTPAAAPGV
ncbi:MAG: MFS transporter [Dehalococcoidia bacterium]